VVGDLTVENHPTPYMEVPHEQAVDTLQEALESGAILIRRAANGWVLESDSPDGDDPRWVEVFQDPSGCPFCEAVSLADLLMGSFEPWMQTPEHGGLKVTLVEEPLVEDGQ
jgi:hypothetical protein